MEVSKKSNQGKKLRHCLVLTFPGISHVKPMLQLSKRLHHKGLKATLVLTKSIFQALDFSGAASASVAVETISDGRDDGVPGVSDVTEAYLDEFERVGSEELATIAARLSGSGRPDPVDCIVCNSFVPWGLDVAERLGLAGALFFTQSCAVDLLYYHANAGSLEVPVAAPAVSLPGLPRLGQSELPRFLSDPVTRRDRFKLLVDPLSKAEKADWVLCNTFYELEPEVVNWMMKTMRLRTIGPTIPSMYLDNRIEGDKQYGLTLTPSDLSFEACINWLNSSPKRSVVYVSFGSVVSIEAEQMKEVACGLRKINHRFLWVVRTSEADKLPKGYVEETSLEKGLVVSWCPQLEVLANDAVGCFVTHCGWNSTLEALSLGVPMVTMPQFSDQFTNEKYIVDVWKVGLKGERDEKGVVRHEELEKCLKEIMEGEKGKELRMNAMSFSELAKKAVDEGGSSDKNIDEFIENIGI